ncbi:MAG: protein kinase domain-containing protein [Gemmatimonadales bacterium]
MISDRLQEASWRSSRQCNRFRVPSPRASHLADVPSSLADALAGRYSVERELGRGGMATVYLARDLKHERLVALKVLRPELAQALGAERFLREIRLTAGLQHPHILPLHDSGAVEGALFYVMPYVEGESLRDRLVRERQLPLEDALGISRAVASALAYAHQQGIVHRDIKPENILLTRQGEALVADFGIAKALGPEGERLTETGLAIGTAAYLSPEQASGDSRVDARSDIYALGCVLYEMLVGEPPYTGPTAQAIVSRRFSAPIPSIRHARPEVPAAIDDAVRRALARTPADRPASAAAFAAALAHRAGARRRWGTVAVAGAALALAGGAVLTVQRRSASVEPASGGSVVVLPLVNAGRDTADEYLVDGFTDDIITRISRFSDVRVVSRSTALRYKGRAAAPRSSPGSSASVRSWRGRSAIRAASSM